MCTEIALNGVIKLENIGRSVTGTAAEEAGKKKEKVWRETVVDGRNTPLIPSINDVLQICIAIS